MPVWRVCALHAACGRFRTWATTCLRVTSYTANRRVSQMERGSRKIPWYTTGIRKCRYEGHRVVCIASSRVLVLETASETMQTQRLLNGCTSRFVCCPFDVLKVGRNRSFLERRLPYREEQRVVRSLLLGSGQIPLGYVFRQQWTPTIGWT